MFGTRFYIIHFYEEMLQAVELGSGRDLLIALDGMSDEPGWKAEVRHTLRQRLPLCHGAVESDGQTLYWAEERVIVSRSIIPVPQLKAMDGIQPDRLFYELMQRGSYEFGPDWYTVNQILSDLTWHRGLRTEGGDTPMWLRHLLAVVAYSLLKRLYVMPRVDEGGQVEVVWPFVAWRDPASAEVRVGAKEIGLASDKEQAFRLLFDAGYLVRGDKDERTNSDPPTL